MSLKIRTDALVAPFSSFHNIENLDRTSAVVSAEYPRANIVNDQLPNQNVCFIQVML